MKGERVMKFVKENVKIFMKKFVVEKIIEVIDKLELMVFVNGGDVFKSW